VAVDQLPLIKLMNLSDCDYFGRKMTLPYRWIPTVRRNMLAPSSVLKEHFDTDGRRIFSEMPVSTYISTTCHNPEQHSLNNQRRSNLKTDKYLFLPS
jgi:hypothetical protein